MEVSPEGTQMRSGRRIKVSVPLQRFQPLRILKVKGKISKMYI